MTNPAQTALDVLSLMVLEDGKRWGETAAGYQWQNAKAILDPDAEARQHWIELPRGARKTTDLAGMLLAILYAQAPPMARLYVDASDEDQAQELIDAAAGLIARTGELEGI
jgi:phage terminase large subunit-like protein